MKPANKRLAKDIDAIRQLLVSGKDPHIIYARIGRILDLMERNNQRTGGSSLGRLWWQMKDYIESRRE